MSFEPALRRRFFIRLGGLKLEELGLGSESTFGFELG